MKRFFAAIIIFSMILSVLWVLGFAIFMFKVNSVEDEMNLSGKADGIVVLTGGRNRINIANELFFTKHLAFYYLVSGIDDSINMAEVKKLFPPINRGGGKVTLDFSAKTTVQNARSVSSWADKNQIKSIHLVTSNYHMPRAINEIKKHQKYLKIIPHRVTSKNVKLDEWWKHKGTRKLLMIEYHKWLVSLILTVDSKK